MHKEKRRLIDAQKATSWKDRKGSTAQAIVWQRMTPPTHSSSCEGGFQMSNAAVLQTSQVERTFYQKCTTQTTDG